MHINKRVLLSFYTGKKAMKQIFSALSLNNQIFTLFAQSAHLPLVKRLKELNCANTDLPSAHNNMLHLSMTYKE